MSPSIQPEFRSRRLRIRAAGTSLFTVGCLLLLAGCGQGTWPDRDPAPVDNIRVDSLRFRPEGGRYVLADSAWKSSS